MIVPVEKGKIEIKVIEEWGKNEGCYKTPSIFLLKVKSEVTFRVKKSNKSDSACFYQVKYSKSGKGKVILR